MSTKPAKGNLGKAPKISDTSAKCLANSCLDIFSKKELLIIPLLHLRRRPIAIPGMAWIEKSSSCWLQGE